MRSMRILQKFLQHSAPHLDWAGLSKSASQSRLVIRPNIHAQIHPERKAPESFFVLRQAGRGHTSTQNFKQ